MSVCTYIMYISDREHISETRRPLNYTRFSVHVACGRGSVQAILTQLRQFVISYIFPLLWMSFCLSPLSNFELTDHDFLHVGRPWSYSSPGTEKQGHRVIVSEVSNAVGLTSILDRRQFFKSSSRTKITDTIYNFNHTRFTTTIL